MKKNVCKIISIFMAALALVAILGAATVTGSGFLDASNIARYFLVGGAVIFALIAIVTGRSGWRRD